MTETIEQKIQRDEAEKTHKVEFSGGILSCSCGWKSNQVFHKMSDVEAASCSHLDSVEM
jgi:hypothetical protein